MNELTPAERAHLFRRYGDKLSYAAGPKGELVILCQVEIEDYKLLHRKALNVDYVVIGDDQFSESQLLYLPPQIERLSIRSPAFGDAAGGFQFCWY